MDSGSGGPPGEGPLLRSPHGALGRRGLCPPPRERNGHSRDAGQSPTDNGKTVKRRSAAPPISKYATLPPPLKVSPCLSALFAIDSKSYSSLKIRLPKADGHSSGSGYILTMYSQLTAIKGLGSMPSGRQVSAVPFLTSTQTIGEFPPLPLDWRPVPGNLYREQLRRACGLAGKWCAPGTTVARDHCARLYKPLAHAPSMSEEV